MHTYPWKPLLLVWLAISALLVVLMHTAILTGSYADPDDLMRLQQVRDLAGGQGWFDMTQHRMAPPAGLSMHWSRLVDIPLLVFMAPLTPLLGQSAAEAVAVTAAPLLTLLVLLVGLVLAMRRLFGPLRSIPLFAPLLLVSAPAVMAQIHPTRIDHHGWQIACAAFAFAGLLARDPRRSGLAAGTATAIFLSISLEGLPFALACAAILALLWVLGRESGARLTAFMVALAGVSATAFVLTAPTLRWSEAYCDALMPAHVITLAVAALGTAGAVRFAGTRTTTWRFVALALAGVATLAVFAARAPQCLGDPLGAMDPLVRRFWYSNVNEALPFWRQPLDGMASMIAFPPLGLAGAIAAFWRARGEESRRRWLLTALLIAATFVTGALVRRAAGVSHVVAIPGAFVLLLHLRARAEGLKTLPGRVLLGAGSILALTPLTPVYAAAFAAAVADRGKSPPAVSATPPEPCDARCALVHVAALPPARMLTMIDLGPLLIATTPHTAYSGSYHRLQRPIAETMRAFMSDPNRARGIVGAMGVSYVLVSPRSDESEIYRRVNPNGLAARLVAGKPPGWLRPVATGSRALLLYRRID